MAPRDVEYSASENSGLQNAPRSRSIRIEEVRRQPILVLRRENGSPSGPEVQVFDEVGESQAVFVNEKLNFKCLDTSKLWLSKS